MIRPFVIAVICLGSSAAVVSSQSLTTAEGRVLLTVTQIDRLSERRFFSGLGPHSEDDVQIEKAGKGREFASLVFSVRWPPDRSGDPCSVDGPPPLLDASQYLLVDDAGSRVAGLEASYYYGASNPCREFTVLFRASRAGATYTALYFQGRRASLAHVAGANRRPSPRPE